MLDGREIRLNLIDISQSGIGPEEINTVGERQMSILPSIRRIRREKLAIEL